MTTAASIKRYPAVQAILRASTELYCVHCLLVNSSLIKEEIKLPRFSSLVAPRPEGNRFQLLKIQTILLAASKYRSSGEKLFTGGDNCGQPKNFAPVTPSQQQVDEILADIKCPQRNNCLEDGRFKYLNILMLYLHIYSTLTVT